MAVADAEEALVRAHEDAQRENKESQNTVHHITAQLHDVESQLSTSEWAWKDAVIVSVTEKAKVHDAQSRVEAYLSEIDRLKLVEAGLCEKVDGLRRASALDEIKRIELSKQINELERDKDLLNVALDLKQTELVLLQRSTRSPMVTPRPDRSYPLAASTSRVSQTSSTQDATPVVSRRLSSSASSGYLRSSHTKRELSMNSVPSTPRTGTFARPAPLGSSTKHNRTSEKRPAVKTPVPASIAAKQPELMRRSSLPVSVGRLGSVKVKERFTSMVVEEESVEVLG